MFLFEYIAVPCTILYYIMEFYVSVTNALDYEVDIFDSRDNNITNNAESISIYEGDYVYCKFRGDFSGPMVYYGWVKIEPDLGEGRNQAGPNFVSLPNEADITNR